MIVSSPGSCGMSSREARAGGPGARSSYLRTVEPMIMSRPRGMARVRKALSRGPFTGEPSFFFGGSMTVKLLSPTDMWTPAKNGSPWMRPRDSKTRLNWPSQSPPTGAIPGSTIAWSFAKPGIRFWASSSKARAGCLVSPAGGGRLGSVDGQGLGRDRLDPADQVGHELGGPRSHVHLDIGSAPFVLAPGQFEQAGHVVLVEKFLRRRYGVVDRLTDNRQSWNGHDSISPLGRRISMAAGLVNIGGT